MQDRMKSFNKYTALFYLAISALIAQRLFHLKNIIEEPMAWRQFDTEFYAYSFLNNGIDLLKPTVCWMGGYKTLILEFPLVSALISLFYKLFGHSILYARIVILLFYIASAVYLYLLIKKIYRERLAKFALIVYLLLPMSVYYSRAVIVDFPVLFFSLGALYYYVLGFEKSKLSLIVIATVFSLFGFLIKSPYQFIIFIPLMYFIIRDGKLKFLLKSLPIIAIPVIAFIFWERYSVGTNDTVPDWSFIPGYFKFTDMTSWYFGTAYDRLDPANWERLLRRFASEGITYIGLPLFITGIFLKPPGNRLNYFFHVYLGGIIIYLLLFFTLNVIHDYYQIPVLVISSFFIANSIDWIYGKLEKNSLLKADLVTGLILLFLMVNGIWYTEKWYYKIDKVRTSSAEFINNNSSENSLVISSIDETDPRDPRILAPAYRCGWSIRTRDLSGKLIDSLISQGSNYLAITSKQNPDPNLELYLKHFKKQEFKLPDNDWKLLLYKLK